MKLSINMVTQILATLVQIVNATGGVLPSKYQVLIAATLGGVQTIVAAVAHFNNPDGTNAKVAYIPPVDSK